MTVKEELDLVLKAAEKINKGEKAFVESLQVLDRIIEWYGNHGTEIEFQCEELGFLVWNPNTLK